MPSAIGLEIREITSKFSPSSAGQGSVQYVRRQWSTVRPSYTLLCEIDNGLQIYYPVTEGTLRPASQWPNIGALNFTSFSRTDETQP